MAYVQEHRMAIAVADEGALGSIPCSTLKPSDILNRCQSFRQKSNGSLNMNFFCHQHQERNTEKDQRWFDSLADLYTRYGVTGSPGGDISVRSFSDEACEIVEQVRPEVVSFHYGLPEKSLVDRVKQTGAAVWSSATSVREAVQLEQWGCDAIIAQGLEAGGHRGHFLESDHTTQLGTFALIPQVADAVDTPVIAAGGISDWRTLQAAFVLGATAVQIGTAYLKSTESTISDIHRMLLNTDVPVDTVITNVFTGRPARSFVNKAINELGPISADVPDFPYALPALAPLKKATEEHGHFSSLWSGQSATLAPAMSSSDLTRFFAEGYLEYSKSQD